MHPLRGISTENRYGLVIVTILVNYVIAAAMHGESGSAWATEFALITIWLVFTVSEAPRARRLAAAAIPVAAGVALVVTLLRPYREGTMLQGALMLANLILYLIAPVLIVSHIFRRQRVDRQTMFAAIAAYLLIGMAFAYAFRILGLVQTTPPLFGEDGPGTMAQVLFFSFITLTTTGYGNLVPAANPAQTLAVLESIMGQLFLVTAMAKIVTAWRLPGERAEAPEES